MNKTDRMLAIILELQRKGAQRAEDLASTFETSVRTIYRDITALCEAGVPVVGMPGQGYTLMEGYFLPPISFTSEEAVMLLLGADFVQQQFDAVYQEKASTARRKIEAILPSLVRQEAERLRAGIRMISMKKPADRSKEIEVLSLLREAVLTERRIRFSYEKYGAAPLAERQTVREVNPYGLTFVNGSWALVGHCHLRGAIRHFLLRRISDLVLLKETAKRPPDFDIRHYTPSDERYTLVRVLADHSVANQIQASHYFFLDSCQEHPDGLLVTLRVRQVEEVLSWVLGWGASIQVLEPESLRKLVCEEIEQIRNQY